MIIFNPITLIQNKYSPLSFTYLILYLYRTQIGFNMIVGTPYIEYHNTHFFHLLIPFCNCIKH